MVKERRGTQPLLPTKENQEADIAASEPLYEVTTKESMLQGPFSQARKVWLDTLHLLEIEAFPKDPNKRRRWLIRKATSVFPLIVRAAPPSPDEERQSLQLHEEPVGQNDQHDIETGYDLNEETLTKLVKTSSYVIQEEGKRESLAYRVFFLNSTGKKVSPWHDIPVHAGNGLLHFVVEIPKESSAKMEVATEEPYTPIKQDIKKGKLRFYPYNINWNYGLLPQTWEDPSHSNGEVEGAFGDNDPVDVVEIGERRAETGEVLKVKPLAVLAMIDEGELDWKIIALSANDPKADLVNYADNVEKHFPGTLMAIRDWFRDYKIPEGKPANKFGLGNKAAGKDYALKVISETNNFWASLVKRLDVAAGVMYQKLTSAFYWLPPPFLREPSSLPEQAHLLQLAGLQSRRLENWNEEESCYKGCGCHLKVQAADLNV
ncbi:hypothetical protein L7F22_010869 [Adiantum nelumboides]|nr:hypothetical protein [Adiantum nelumboides]